MRELSEQNKNLLNWLEMLETLAPEEKEEMNRFADRLQNNRPLYVDLCVDCELNFWMKRGHRGITYCPYCGKQIFNFVEEEE